MKFFSFFLRYFRTGTVQNRPGFTLMEIMVAVSIFAIVMVVGISSLLVINTTNLRSRAERQAVDEVSFLLEAMSRKIRTGTAFTQPLGTSSISFTNQREELEAYTFTPGNPAGTLDYSITPLGGVAEQYTLAAFAGGQTKFWISSLTFTILGGGDADGQQPLVVIRIAGQARERNQSVPFSVETAISPRILQLEAAPVVQ